MADEKLGSDPVEYSQTTPTETPTATLSEATSATPTEAPTATLTEAPTATQMDTSTKAPSQTPTEALTETPTEAPSEAPTEIPTETPPSLEKTDIAQDPTPVADTHEGVQGGPDGVQGGPDGVQGEPEGVEGPQVVVTQDAVPNGVTSHLSDGDSASLSSQATQKRLSKIPEEGDTGACRDPADERTELLEKRQSQVVVSNGDVTVHVVPDAAEDIVAKGRDAGGRGGAPRRALMWLKKNEFLILLIGSVTLFLGCILLAVGGYMMRAAGTCPTAALADPHAHTADGSHFHVDVDGYVGYSNPYEGEAGNASAPGNDTHDEGDNLALGRPAYQSTAFTEDDQTFQADLAVDDSPDFNFKDGSCARTERETLPYWYVDLGEPHRVRSVHIMLPTDCCIAEMHNFEVRVGQREDRLVVNSLCRYYMGTALRSTIKVTCESPLVGRYVSIQMLGDDTRPINRLNLCEVRVYS